MEDNQRNRKEQQISEFLESLGGSKSKGFTVICNFCNSMDVIKYYEEEYAGSEYTDPSGSLGIKCKGCGNAEEFN